MAGVRIVAARCAACGKFTVWLDGRRVATVDTHASTTNLRQLVYSRSISATPGKHTLRLVVLGTAGRPRVYLDGIGTLK
jgi:ribosomal protein L19E